MNTSQIYILISIVVLAGIMVILIVTRKRIGRPLFQLATLAFLFILAGIIFGENRITGYSLMGVGIILAVIDIIRQMKNKKNRG